MIFIHFYNELFRTKITWNRIYIIIIKLYFIKYFKRIKMKSKKYGKYNIIKEIGEGSYGKYKSLIILLLKSLFSRSRSYAVCNKNN